MTISKALQEVFNYRDQFNADKKKHISSENYSIYFGINSKGKPTASFYRGRSRKSQSYYFHNEEKRQNYVDTYILECEKEANNKKTRKSESTRILNVGDVLYSSWGYEQTNIDFYLVTALVGKSSVKIIKISGTKEYQEDMTGLVIPDINSTIGEEITKRVTNGNVVKISSYNSSSPAEYQEIANCRIYKGYHFSCYA
jgi:hypothetical protein